jgi:DNA-binding CsgD family transcriptional regulator
LKTEEINKLSVEEREFLDRLLSKSHAAITYTMKKHLGDMYNDLCDDCLSDIYWLAVNKVSDMIKLNKPEKWLIGATKILSANIKRVRCRQLNQISLESIEDIECSDDLFEIVLHNIWMEQDAYNYLKRELTKRELEVFELMFEQRKACVEISKELDISESTVWNIRKNIKDKYRYAIKNKLF